MPLYAVERKPVLTRVLNPNASEASYKPNQRNGGKTKLKKIKQIVIFLEQLRNYVVSVCSSLRS